MTDGVDILCIVAHPDDAEIAAGGTIALHVDRGYRVGIVDLTRGEMGTRGNAELRDLESAAASKVLGISFRENLDLGDGVFHSGVEHRMKVMTAIRKWRPSIVITNALDDRHPDHGKAAALVAEACFYSGLPKMITYAEGVEQAAWRPGAVYHMIQDYYQEPDFVIDVTPFWDKKMEALRCYSSQFYDPSSNEPITPISGPDFFDFLISRAVEFGRPSGMRLAEGFVSSRRFGVKDLHDLI
ncbi:MAG: hypothetical protein RL220_1186 [Bacteroidota bacterium]